MVVMVPLTAAYRLRKILKIGKLTALGGTGKIACELVKLTRGVGITLGLGGLGGGLQIAGDIGGHLLVFCGIGLLELLKRAGELRER